MARMKRLVVPGLPHYVAQRGVRSMDVFDEDEDRELYLALLREHGERGGVEFLAWCLMPGRIHLIVVPRKEESLARGIGEAHRRYTRAKNLRTGVRGYLFEGRFSSCVLDKDHLLPAARYVELRPVAAGIVDAPEEYDWSSARGHLDGRRKDPLVAAGRLDVARLVPDWREFLGEGVDEITARRIEMALSTGRPLGSERFVEGLEKRTGRMLRRQRPGPRKGRRGRRAHV